MELHNLKPAEGSTKKEKRIGRGQGSGHYHHIAIPLLHFADAGIDIAPDFNNFKVWIYA